MGHLLMRNGMMNQALGAGHVKRQQEIKWRKEAIKYLKNAGAVSENTALPSIDVPYSNKRPVINLISKGILIESNGYWYVNSNPPKSVLYVVGKGLGTVFQRIRRK